MRLVRTLLRWALVALGAAAAARWWRERRAGRTAPAEPLPATSDPKEALRRTLAASRPDDAPHAVEADEHGPLEERRAEVHAEARATIEEMRSGNGGG